MFENEKNCFNFYCVTCRRGKGKRMLSRQRVVRGVKGMITGELGGGVTNGSDMRGIGLLDYKGVRVSLVRKGS